MGGGENSGGCGGEGEGDGLGKGESLGKLWLECLGSRLGGWLLWLWGVGGCGV